MSPCVITRRNRTIQVLPSHQFEICQPPLDRVGRIQGCRRQQAKVLQAPSRLWSRLKKGSRKNIYIYLTSEDFQGSTGGCLLGKSSLSIYLKLVHNSYGISQIEEFELLLPVKPKGHSEVAAEHPAAHHPCGNTQTLPRGQYLVHMQRTVGTKRRGSGCVTTGARHEESIPTRTFPTNW
jgi:hypothetical protein